MRKTPVRLVILTALLVALAAGALMWSPQEVGACPEYLGCNDPLLIQHYCFGSSGQRACAESYLKSHCGGVRACIVD